MSMLVDEALAGYQPSRSTKHPAIFEVLGAINEMVVQFGYVHSVPVKSITEVRGWYHNASQGDTIIDCKVDGLWMAYAL